MNKQSPPKRLGSLASKSQKLHLILSICVPQCIRKGIMEIYLCLFCPKLEIKEQRSTPTPIPPQKTSRRLWGLPNRGQISRRVLWRRRGEKILWETTTMHIVLLRNVLYFDNNKPYIPCKNGRVSAVILSKLIIQRFCLS